MKVICSQQELLAAVQTAARCVASRTVIPVLGGISISTAPSGLILKATDLEIAVECSIPAQVIEEGNTVISARYLADLVRRLPGGEITLDLNSQERVVTFTYGNAHFKLNTFSGEDFPLFPPVEGVLEDAFSQKQFKSYIRQVAIAASPEPIRPVFNGVLWEVKEGSLRMVATDTHRLALRTGIPVSPQTEKGLPSVIIPVRALTELSRLLQDDEEAVLRVATGDGQISFITPDFVLTARTIEGRFPDYERALPSSFQTTVKVNRNELLSSLERASLLTSAKERSSVVKIEVRDRCIALSSYAADLGSLYEEINAQQEGEGIEINFNARYLIEALRVLEEEEVILNFVGPLSPCIIQTGEDEGYLYLLLPVKV